MVKVTILLCLASGLATTAFGEDSSYAPSSSSSEHKYTKEVGTDTLTDMISSDDFIGWFHRMISSDDFIG